MMYPWLWRRLPGPAWVKVAVLAIAAVAVVAVLFEWVFPWVSEALTIQEQTVGE